MTIEARSVAYAGIKGILSALTPTDRHEVLRVLLRDNPPVGTALPRLTPRELSLLEFYAAGASDAQITHGLGMTTTAAQKASDKLRRKLGADNRAHCVAIALRGGLIA